MTIIRAGNRRKSDKIKKFAKKKEKTALQEKGFPNKKKKGEKGNIENSALQKKKGTPKKKIIMAEPIFLNPKKSPLLSIQPGGKSY